MAQGQQVRGRRECAAGVVVLDHRDRQVDARRGPAAQHEPGARAVEQPRQAGHAVPVLRGVLDAAEQHDGVHVLLAHHLHERDLAVRVAEGRADHDQPVLGRGLLLHTEDDAVVERRGDVAEQHGDDLRAAAGQGAGVRVDHVVEVLDRPHDLRAGRRGHRVVAGDDPGHGRHRHPGPGRDVADRRRALRAGRRGALRPAGSGAAGVAGTAGTAEGALRGLRTAVPWSSRHPQRIRLPCGFHYSGAVPGAHSAACRAATVATVRTPGRVPDLLVEDLDLGEASIAGGVDQAADRARRRSRRRRRSHGPGACRRGAAGPSRTPGRRGCAPRPRPGRSRRPAAGPTTRDRCRPRPRPGRPGTARRGPAPGRAWRPRRGRRRTWGAAARSPAGRRARRRTAPARRGRRRPWPGPRAGPASPRGRRRPPGPGRRCRCRPPPRSRGGCRRGPRLAPPGSRRSGSRRGTARSPPGRPRGRSARPSRRRPPGRGHATGRCP